MLTRLRCPPFAMILVWKPSHFARSRAAFITCNTLLGNEGIGVVSITEPTDDVLTGRLLEEVSEPIEEFYSATGGAATSQGGCSRRIPRRTTGGCAR